MRQVRAGLSSLVDSRRRMSNMSCTISTGRSTSALEVVPILSEVD